MSSIDDVQECQREETPSALIAVSAVFESFGRILICLDRDFRVLHVSALVRRMIGDDAPVLGKPISALFGDELFGEDGAMRRALEQNERREGWRAPLRLSDGTSRFISISAAPLQHDRFGICDPRVVYILMGRPAEEVDVTGAAAPTVFGGMIARSGAMAHLFDLVQNLQTSEATILLTGESGTGKELLARAIHTNSLRREGRFVAINCAALPAELLESELFGHVRGAFT
ncbi:MAG: sigma 54-interacting transcriptional regulator, partial [Thermoanaerobaculia bacterium]